jgi:hypothetical protein
MFVTPNMGLTAWDLGVDPYDHAQLASNFAAIDSHDHTLGKGIQIPSGGILDAAITSAKIAGDAVVPTTHIPIDSIPQSRLADNSVGAGELQDNSVDTAALADNAVTFDKLDASVLPLGTVVMWYRGDPAIFPPVNWEVMDGRAWSTITNNLGPGGVALTTGSIPNMANRFPLGAALSGTGTGPGSSPAIGGTGGQHERDISHTHTANAHSHIVDSHIHGITADGSHSHLFVAQPGNVLMQAFTRDVGVPRAEGTRQALYVPGHNSNSSLGSNVAAPLSTQSNHDHTGSTGASAAGTSLVTTTINSWASGNVDFRPGHVGLLFIMKVR